MQKKIALIIAVCVWFSVITQLYLIIENRTASIPETIIRFFSFFTILTNTLVAVYFTAHVFKIDAFRKPGILTALTVYITIVGAVYQLLLRHIWQPTGLQMVVDELLHSINPVLVILFWYSYEEKRTLKYSQIISWLIYPLVYLICILLRGAFSGFYPYPFINVLEIGINQTMINSGLLLLFFMATSFVFIVLGHILPQKNLLSGEYRSNSE